jgi:hypothetical protein
VVVAPVAHSLVYERQCRVKRPSPASTGGSSAYPADSSSRPFLTELFRSGASDRGVPPGGCLSGSRTSRSVLGFQMEVGAEVGSGVQQCPKPRPG